MKRTIAVLISSVFIVSCYTQKKAINQSIKAYSYYPDEVKKLHLEWFKPSIKTVIEKEYIKGEDSLIIDTVEVDCDLVKDSVVKIVKVPYEKHHYRVDTFKMNQIDTIINTVEIDVLKNDINVLREDNIRLSERLKTIKNRYYFALSWFALSIIAIIIYLIIKLKKIF